MKASPGRWACLVATAAIVMALPGGAEPVDKAEEARRAQVVARVGDATITVGDIEDRIARHMRPDLFKDPEQRRELVSALMDRELLVQEAKKRKLDENKRVVDHLKRILYNQIQTKYVTEKLPLESISMDEISAYYKEHEGEYNQPTLVRAYHILLDKREEAQAVLDQAKAESMDLRAFKVLAGERSQDEATKSRGGDLRYFSADGKVWTSDETVPPPVAQAAFSIEIFVEASVIVTTDETKAREAMDKAIAPGLTDAAFAKLVAKYKAESPECGSLGYFNLEGKIESAPNSPPVPWDLTRAAFSVREAGKTYPKVIKIGDKLYILRITGRKDPGNLYQKVVESDQGFHVVWVVNRRPSVSKTVQDMEPSIRQRIWQDKKKDFMTKLIEDLKKKHNVQVFYDKLSDVEIDLSSTQPGTEQMPGPPMPLETPKIQPIPPGPPGPSST